MTAIEVAQKVTVEKTCHLVRARRSSPGQYDAKPYGDGGNKKGWFYLDLFTASAIVAVDEGLSEANRAKFRALEPLARMAAVAHKVLLKAKAAA